MIDRAAISRTFRKNTYRKIEIQALLSRNRRIKQTARFFQNDLSVALLFFRIITINFSAMSNDNFGPCLRFFREFPYPLEKFFIYTPPQPLANFRLLAPLPLGISIDLPWVGRGGMDIFWNCTIENIVLNVLKLKMFQ